MTKLNRNSVKRELRPFGYARPLTVIINGDTQEFEFREKHSRTTYYYPIQTAWIEAIRKGWKK